VVQVTLAAITYPQRLARHWAYPSEPSRPMAALIMPPQSREAHKRPVPGTNSSPSPVPGRVAQVQL
jgi:hypothetical protein